MRIRELIFEIAESNPEIGEIEETLKWGEPSYIPSKTKSGTTIRIDHKADKEENGIFVHCQTSLIDDFRSQYEDRFKFDGNRGIIFSESEEIPLAELKGFIKAALTYHLNK